MLRTPSQGILHGNFPVEEVMQAENFQDRRSPRQPLAFQPFVLGQQSRVSSATFLGF